MHCPSIHFLYGFLHSSLERDTREAACCFLNGTPTEEFETETAIDPEIETAANRSSEVTYGSIFTEAYHNEGEDVYRALCDGPEITYSKINILDAYELYLTLSSPVIYAKVEQAFSVPTYVVSESSQEYRPSAYDITYRIAEPELLDVLSVHRGGIMGRQSGDIWGIPTNGLIEGQIPGFAVRSLSPGIAHLYIRVTHRESGEYMTMQQVIVIEE